MAVRTFNKIAQYRPFQSQPPPYQQPSTPKLNSLQTISLSSLTSNALHRTVSHITHINVTASIAGNDVPEAEHVNGIETDESQTALSHLVRNSERVQNDGDDTEDSRTSDDYHDLPDVSPATLRLMNRYIPNNTKKT